MPTLREEAPEGLRGALLREGATDNAVKKRTALAVLFCFRPRKVIFATSIIEGSRILERSTRYWPAAVYGIILIESPKFKRIKSVW